MSTLTGCITNCTCTADWMEVPTNTMIIVTPKMNVLQIPILDEHSPSDRPHPTRVPVKVATKAFGPSRNAAAAAEPDLRAPSRLFIDSTRSSDSGAREEACDDEDSRGHHGAEARDSVHFRAASTRQRSPTFALNAGFPPNGHIGGAGVSAAPVAATSSVVHGGSSPAKVSVATAAAR